MGSPGVMIGCRVDGKEMYLGDDHGFHSVRMYVVGISNNWIFGLVKRKGVYVEGTSIETHQID